VISTTDACSAIEESVRMAAHIDADEEESLLLIVVLVRLNG
jgi:hypothetical protein